MTDFDKTLGKKRFSIKKFFWIVYKVFLFWLIFTLIQVIVLKWAPVAFTPTMFFRSIGAYLQGKDARIYYQWASYAQISDHAKVAVVASEDQRFPRHFGMDLAALNEAVKDYKTRGRLRGGSTISQQVAKNVFLWQGGGFVRKALEIPYTLLIELIWGKQRILEVYLNIAEMGPQTFGVQAASKRFFRKTAKNLSPTEAATLAAVLPSPLRYSAQSPSYYINLRSQQIQYQMRMLGGFSYLQGLRKF
ncbi:MAG: monofunctional biosynthetic peptidoglycan transglycosylase [Microscillaceae bacterium]|nr:monofunctional biosynthetic peptidoglycan transglycosylase [Microscillaceae bacterium]